jgi:Fe-S-cluster containining protein
VSEPASPDRADDLDCRACGACCRQIPDGTALVSAEDLVRWKREGRDDILRTLVPGHFSQQGLGTDEAGTCHFLGTPDNPHDCSIYETRGWACHALEKGSPQCLTYRRLYRRSGPATR